MTQKIIKRRDSAPLESDTLPPILKKIYGNRGISQSDEIDHQLNALLPFTSLLNIDQGVALLVTALQQQQRILIIGDFDADGATSSALAMAALRSFGAKYVDYLVPNRFEFGYGLTPEIIAVAKLRDPQLIITVDNGISSNAGVAAANDAGIQVLITDHHLPPAELPHAAAIINPNQVGDNFPSKNLCGVGVIFYTLIALRSELRALNWFQQQQLAEPNMTQFLDLVALGTVADVVPLDKNNRILVAQGLRIIRSEKCRPGIKALLTIAKRQISTITASDLGFAVAPRLNAAGRLDDMSLGIACLLETDPIKATELAQRLDSLNTERRSIENEMQQQAMSALTKFRLEKNTQLPFGLCLFDESWHQGVIGILASRIKDHLHRPVIAFAKVSEQEIKGSARSIPGLHIRDVLDRIAVRNPQLIAKFGGHAMAAGLSMDPKNLKTFADLFNSTITEFSDQVSFTNQLLSDGALTSDEFTLATVELIQNAGPWGQSFPEPLFDGKFRLFQQRLLADKHLKCVLGIEGSSHLIPAIAFNVDRDMWPNYECSHVNVAFRLAINDYQGNKNLQLVIEWLEPCEALSTA